MRMGIIYLYCPICGVNIIYTPNKPTQTRHSKEFGIVCSQACYESSEMKYARHILGKDDVQSIAPLDKGTSLF